MAMLEKHRCQTRRQKGRGEQELMQERRGEKELSAQPAPVACGKQIVKTSLLRTWLLIYSFCKKNEYVITFCYSCLLSQRPCIFGLHPFHCSHVRLLLLLLLLLELQHLGKNGLNHFSRNSTRLSSWLC